MKRICFVLVLLFCSLGLLRSQETRKVRLQLKWKHQFQFAGYYAAKDQGYYKSEGLDVEILEAESHKTPFDTVFEGKAEFGTSTTDIILARASGLKPVVLANIFQHSPHIVISLKGSGIKYVHDLSDKKIAAEPAAADLYAYLLSEGLTLDELQVEELDFNLDKLITGQVDAITAYSTDQPFPLKELGYELNVLSPSSGGIDFYGDLLFTSESMIRSDPDLVEKFTRASLKGWRYALHNREEMVQLIYNKYSQRHSLGHLRFEAEETYKLVLPNVVEIGYINPGRWAAILDSYKLLKRVDAKLTIQGMLIQDYQKKPIVIPWKLIIILSVALLATIMIVIYLWKLSKELRQEIKTRERTQLELLRSQELIEAKNESLVKISSQKDKFFSIIAHDLRSPFNGFLGITQLLLECGDGMSTQEHESYLKDLNKSARNLYRLLENLLQWSKMERGLSKAQMQSIDLSSLIQEVSKLFKHSATEKELSFEYSLQEGLIAWADPQMVETILRNLISNALKYSNRGGVIKISVRKSDNGQIVISVQDQGIGIPTEFVHTLFEIDSQKYRTGTEGEPSTGLGLILSKEFVELNQGQLWVESREGHGSTFSFTLNQGS
ncbi:MAG: ABC transporter substrate-binding protein [Candidatus Cloacimonetes bacterium]|nr:ABC transporter substrate-binding protein [Candidatus Cloacimonadota bacterium]